MSENDDEAAAKEAAANQLAAKRAIEDEVASRQAADEIAAKQAATAVAADKQAQDDAEIEEILDATVATSTTAPAFEAPSEKGYDPSQYQDKTRSYIAYWLLSLLTLMVLGGFILPFAVTSVTFENLKSILELVFGPIIALVSAATGFYFGAQQSGSGKRL